MNRSEFWKTVYVVRTTTTGTVTGVKVTRSYGGTCETAEGAAMLAEEARRVGKSWTVEVIERRVSTY